VRRLSLLGSLSLYKWRQLQLIEGLSNPDNSSKVPLRGTFEELSGFYGSARRCIVSKKSCALRGFF
jgi:hypothetical protein